MFEDAPDDNANWGEIINTEEKLYKTTSSDSESESKSDSDENLKINDIEKEKRSLLTGISRAQTAKSLKNQNETRRELNDLKNQLESLEQKRMDDIARLESQLESSNRKIEHMLGQIIDNITRNGNK